ncbi:MAG: hypothetical protein JW807_06090 [Spirochaetes bacterium]|nr:hypothetical protein [Spirochaetota bacterium]
MLVLFFPAIFEWHMRSSVSFGIPVTVCAIEKLTRWLMIESIKPGARVKENFTATTQGCLFFIALGATV